MTVEQWHRTVSLMYLAKASCADCPDMTIQRDLRDHIEDREKAKGYTDAQLTDVRFWEFNRYDDDLVEVTVEITFEEGGFVGA